MLKRKGRRLAALLSALVCMSAVAIPASAKVCQSQTSGTFTAQTGYNGTNIYGSIANSRSSGSMTAIIDGSYRYAGSTATFDFSGYASGNGYYQTANDYASKVVSSATGYGDFYGSAGGESKSFHLTYN